MKTKVILSVLSILAMATTAQALTLGDARQMAHDNYPAIKQYRMIEQSRDFTIGNIKKGWLPKVSASAGAYAFTDILKSNPIMNQVGVDIKNWTTGASVVVSQNVYDGGQTSAQQLVAKLQSEVQKNQLDVSLYAINERVDQLYFGILLLDEQISQNLLLQDDLATSEKTIRTMITGGVANQGDLESVLVEKLKVAQQYEALSASRKAYVRMLEIFIGRKLPVEETLEKPTLLPPADKGNVLRPELSYYSSQNRLVSALRKQLDTQLLPTVSVFGMGQIHSQVSDFLHKSILFGGVTLSWNIGALYTRKNDIRKLEVQQALNNSQRETFLFQIALQNEQSDGAIDALRKQIAQDNEIVALRESIRSKSERKVQLGTESVNELVRNINAVSMARLQKACHEVELLKEIYKQKNNNNK